MCMRSAKTSSSGGSSTNIKKLIESWAFELDREGRLIRSADAVTVFKVSVLESHSGEGTHRYYTSKTPPCLHSSPTSNP